MKKLHSILVHVIKDIIGDHTEVGLGLSGGVDSVIIGKILKDLGIKVTSYIFHMEGVLSSDWIYGVEASKYFGFEIQEIIIPTKFNYNFFESFFKDYNLKKKTNIECTHPFFYVFPKLKEDLILVGFQKLFVDDKKGILHYSQTLKLTQQYKEKIGKDTKQLDTLQLMAKKYNKQIEAPFFQKEVVDYFWNKTWEELNKPLPKNEFYTLFPELWNFLKKRKPQNFQCGDTEIREYFEKNILDSKYNTRNRSRVMDIYRDISKEIKELSWIQ